MMRSMSAIGFCVGWPTRSKCVAIKACEAPHIRGIAAFIDAIRTETLVLLIEPLGFLIERLANGVEIKIIFRRLREPDDFLVAVGEEAVRPHAVRVVPDNEVHEVEQLFASDFGNDREQIAASSFALILKPAKDHKISAVSRARAAPQGAIAPPTRCNRRLVLIGHRMLYGGSQTISCTELSGSFRRTSRESAANTAWRVELRYPPSRLHWRSYAPAQIWRGRSCLCGLD